MSSLGGLSPTKDLLFVGHNKKSRFRFAAIEQQILRCPQGDNSKKDADKKKKVGSGVYPLPTIHYRLLFTKRDTPWRSPSAGRLCS